MSDTTTTELILTEKERELFAILACHDIASVRVTFMGGWDYSERQEIEVLGRDGNPMDEEIIDDWLDDIDDIWLDRAWTMGDGYDEYRRYDAGEYYNGTDDEDYFRESAVLFDVRANTITLDAWAKVRVVEYRTDHVVKTWQERPNSFFAELMEPQKETQTEGL